MPVILERRKFLAGAGLAWLSGLAPASAARLAGSEVLFASAYMDAQGAYGVAILDENAGIVSTALLPDRGHGFATTPQSDWLIAFARRPGNFAVAMNRKRAFEPVAFHTPEDRHFYGHGAFSLDGRLLFAAENAFETGDGIIGIYDATDGFTRIGEYPSHGIGPHEIVLMPDGKTLCVANGGIRTHPRQGRQKLNLPAMAPSVALIDAQTGGLLSSHALPAALHRLSLRHMAVDAERTVWIGGQYEGDAIDDVPVLARLERDAGLASVELAAGAAAELGKYVGSMAIGNDGSTLAVSSPKNGVVLTLDTRSARVLDTMTSARTCGVQARGKSFVSSNETGRFADQTYDRAWDNHIAAIR